MAKRYVEECDLCKKEAELDHSITIKPHKGKKTGRSYDLCDLCKESLEKALISHDSARVTSGTVPRISTGTSRNSEPVADDEDTLELPDGTTRTIPTRHEITEGAGDDPGVFDKPLPTRVMEETGERCLHMNKSRVRIRANSSKVEQQCRDCGANLPYRSARDKELELNAKPHAGVTVKTHESEDRKRE